VFIAIGHDPRSDLFKGQLETDSDGYLAVDHPSTRTAIDGVFACGDVALEPITGLGALYVNDAFLRLDAESNLFPHTV